MLKEAFVLPRMSTLRQDIVPMPAIRTSCFSRRGWRWYHNPSTRETLVKTLIALYLAQNNWCWCLWMRNWVCSKPYPKVQLGLDGFNFPTKITMTSVSTVLTTTEFAWSAWMAWRTSAMILVYASSWMHSGMDLSTPMEMTEAPILIIRNHQQINENNVSLPPLYK